jgi:hypothetical protein
LAPPPTMPIPGNMPQGSYMAQILARGYIEVGVDQNTYLWGYRDPATGDLTGFDVDMLQQVSQAIFGSPGHIDYVIVPNKLRPGRSSWTSPRSTTKPGRGSLFRATPTSAASRT